MKCSSRSTLWASSLAALAVTWAAFGLAPAAAQDAGSAVEAAARAAIVDAVRARVGDAAEVRLDDVVIKAPRAGDRLIATPEPGARLGRPIRFSLSSARNDAAAGMTWVAGYAVATVTVTTDCAHAARFVPAGTVLSADDVITGRADLGVTPLQRVPAAAEVIGAKTLRPLEAGDVLLAATIAVRQAVRSGDTVTIRVVVGGVEATGSGVATQGGSVGDTIRVVNSTSRRPTTARVVGPGEVEVIR